MFDSISASSSVQAALQRSKSAVHVMALACVWLTFASSSIVFQEPAPVDALTIGLFILLPVIGLLDVRPALAGCFGGWLVVGAGTAVAAMLARDQPLATGHSIVSFYLSGACFLFAAFVAKNPLAHTRLILNGTLVAALIAAVLGIAGYLSLFPGANDMFTRYDRATGPFKDPNVFGPFLICGLLTVLHHWLTKPMSRGLLPALAGGVLAVGILFSFSRGAWAAAAIALSLYGYLYLITAKRNWDRIKLGGFILLGAAVLAMVLLLALQSDAISALLQQRASLTQSYDVGAEGRFGGQEKAIGLILENPLGLGAQGFTRFYHHEEVHNVYLSMFLNGGWIGGLAYFIICAGTLALGFRHALIRSATQPLFLIVYSALAANILEGVLIDSDHWRHFYHLMGITWGLMAADVRVPRQGRILRRKATRFAGRAGRAVNVRPIDEAAVASPIVVPRRAARIVGRAPGPVVVRFGKRRDGRSRP